MQDKLIKQNTVYNSFWSVYDHTIDLSHLFEHFQCMYNEPYTILKLCVFRYNKCAENVHITFIFFTIYALIYRSLSDVFVGFVKMANRV